MNVVDLSVSRMRPIVAPLAALVMLCTSACAGQTESIEVPTRTGYDFTDFSQPGPATISLSGHLVLPADGRVRGAAILSHGAAGPGARQDRAARLLAEDGIAALVLDHFSARGVSSVARDQLRISEQQMVADVFAARRELSRRLDLEPERIGAIGWSKGGTAVTLAAVRRLGGYVRPDGPPLAFAAAFYPFCGFELDNETLASPLLLLLAGKDDWTPAPPCVRQADAWKARGQPVTSQVYQDASHGFDSRARRFRAGSAITVRDTSARCTLRVEAGGRTATLDGELSLATPKTRRAFLAACGERGTTFAGDPGSGADALRRLRDFIRQAVP